MNDFDIFESCSNMIKESINQKRQAQCTQCDRDPVDSNSKLAFFTSTANDSNVSDNCVCGFTLKAHDRVDRWWKCDGYKRKGELKFDRYYCGCKGWG